MKKHFSENLCHTSEEMFRLSLDWVSIFISMKIRDLKFD